MLNHFNEVVDAFTVAIFIQRIACEVQQMGHWQEILSLGNRA